MALRGRAGALGADAGALPEKVEWDREHSDLHVAFCVSFATEEIRNDEDSRR